MDRNALRRGVFEARRHVRHRSRPDHTQRTDLVDAGVARIELKKDIVAPHVAGNSPAKVCLNPLSLLIELGHGWLDFFNGLLG
jgi:hypothetical protein